MTKLHPTARLAWTIGCALLLAACAQPTGAPAKPAAQPTSVQPAAQPPTAQAPAAQSAADKTYTIGISQLFPHPVLDTFRGAVVEELGRQGFAEGRNLRVDYQNAQGDVNTAKTIADKFVADRVDLVFTITTPASIAAAKATSSIPVVFGYVSDPVAAGIVPSLDKPGGNVTGVHILDPVADQLKLVKEIVPNARTLGTVWNPGETNSRVLVGLMKQHAPELGLEIVEATATNSGEVPAATRSLVGKVDAIFITGDNTAQSALASIVKVAEDNRIPLLTSDVKSVDVGAIATYNFFEEDVGAQTGQVIARVLRGEKPGDIPIEGPKKFHLVINPGAAQRMGVILPESVLRRADRMVQ